MRIPTILVLLLAAISSEQPIVAQTAQNEGIEAAAATRLATEFVRMARIATSSEPLSTTAISTAVILIQESLKLDPKNPSIWRAAIEVAQMADRSDFELEAIRGLLQVTPNDTTVQLARLRSVIEKTNTVEQRMALYESLLSDGRSKLLDPRVASRLAFDASLLQRQLGDLKQFARWLAEAVALDPSYPDAISMAAGFFGDETADSYTRAELLSATMLSNIRDVTLQVSLAEFLMSYGDYKDAAQMYRVVLSESIEDDIRDGLLADILLSQWAVGGTSLALDILTRRQTLVDVAYRKKTKQQNSRMTPLEIARIHAPLIPKLATIRAVIYAERDSRSEAEQALASAIGSIHTLASIYETQGDRATIKVADLKLQAVWILLWLSNDVAQAQQLIEEVEQSVVIHDTEKTRLNGWIALKRGGFEEAISILSAIPNDNPAKLGIALANQQLGNKQKAATQFLDIAKTDGGSILGVWSRKQLEKIVGTTFDIRPEIQNLQELMINIFNTINNYVLDPRPVIDIQIVSQKMTFSPYDPVTAEIEITNNTTIPLVIAKNGPIQPLILVEALIEIPNVDLGTVPPIIIPINSEVSLLPRQSIRTSVELRQYWPGGLFNSFPLRGASLRLRATVNFAARNTTSRSGQNTLVYETGWLGSTDKVTGIRVDGIRLTDEWLESALVQAKKMNTIDDLTAMVLLSWIVDPDVPVAVVPPLIPLPASNEPKLSDEEIIDTLKTDAVTTILIKFPSLGPMAQSWVLTNMSGDESLEAVVGMLQNPNGKTTIISQLIRLVSSGAGKEALQNRTLLNSFDSSDKDIKTLATWVKAYVENAYPANDIE
jgi:tetratricopeptide (TPR) repeat protein